MKRQSKARWKGKVLEEMTREELYQAIAELNELRERDRRQHEVDISNLTIL